MASSKEQLHTSESDESFEPHSTRPSQAQRTHVVPHLTSPALHQVSVDGSSRSDGPRGICFRISNAPLTTDLLACFEDLDASLSTTHGIPQLSLYPACSGASQVALLSPVHYPQYLQDLGPYDNYLVRRPDFDILINRDFHGLTPLNVPKGDIIAEFVSSQHLAEMILIAIVLLL